MATRSSTRRNRFQGVYRFEPDICKTALVENPCKCYRCLHSERITDLVDAILGARKRWTRRRVARIQRRLREHKDKSHIEQNQRVFVDNGELMDVVRNPDWKDSDYGATYYLQEHPITKELWKNRENEPRARIGRLSGLLGQCARGARDVDPCNNCSGTEEHPFRSCRQVFRKSCGDTKDSLLWGGACTGCVFRRCKEACSLYQQNGVEDIDDDQFEGILGLLGEEKGRKALKATYDEEGKLDEAWQSDTATEGVESGDSESSEVNSVDPESEGRYEHEWSEYEDLESSDSKSNEPNGKDSENEGEYEREWSVPEDLDEP
ncbi:hypothetical protein NA57DRAFT_52761 [Rhizodiscina lignyota]|uniref:Uncharacterized protein n=1 Tax=Rhizodiscina lignyota TaxID=1504668 RepID=A0A9P4IKI4_9PEZI|nr:hypothetical protein NA57DRAFT_52761 [Rhizodiscina lignyota]